MAKEISKDLKMMNLGKMIGQVHISIEAWKCMVELRFNGYQDYLIKF